MNENKFTLKNFPPNTSTFCRLTVDFACDGSDYEYLNFFVEDGKLLGKLKGSIYQGTSLRSKYYNLANTLNLTKLYSLKFD
ncbi:unnamed protein product [Hymenolepis diminuta]|uniref:Uncharacterized protein n=1 Tax=Hymenolepis diminuta TaxID=6216 RepID=A0A564Z7Q9_HYMDI|nr:unnamed protein product [Hymenolepis diminuta]